MLHDEISSIIDRLSSPSKTKSNVIESSKKTLMPIQSHIQEIVVENIEIINDATSTTNTTIDTTERMQADCDSISVTVDTFEINIEKYRQMIPYNTTDQEKISQQESILELLISNGICNDETFKIFIAEPDLHKEKASQILDSLYCVTSMMPVSYENENSIDLINEINSASIDIVPADENTYLEASDDNTITSNKGSCKYSNVIKFSFHCLTQFSFLFFHSIAASNEKSSSDESASQNESSLQPLFPIFQKNFSANYKNTQPMSSLNKTTKKWIPIGNQYQIDAGQKQFGLRQCKECLMQYVVNEPEEEIFHQQYHNSIRLTDGISLKRWTDENIVTEISEWGVDGRIIFVSANDNKHRKNRIKQILQMVDRDLGAVQSELTRKTLVCC